MQKRCPSCEEAEEAKRAAQEEARLQLQQAKVRRQWREACGIQRKFQISTFESFERKLQPAAFNAAQKFAETYPLENPFGFPSLILYSVPPTYGVGKTHLASAVAHRIIDRWHGDPERAVCPVLFTTEPELLLRIQVTYNLRELEREWHEREEEVFADLKGKMLLILDDVGTERRTDPRFVQRIYFHVINGRYERELPVLITSNLGMRELEAHMGERVVERLLEMCQGRKVELKGKSFRGKLGKQHLAEQENASS